MNAENATGPAKDLMWTAIFCFVLGLMLMVFSVWVYLCYWDKMQLDALDSDGSAEDSLALIRALTFGIVPLAGFAFSCVGCILWKHYDQCRTLRKPPE